MAVVNFTKKVRPTLMDAMLGFGAGVMAVAIVRTIRARVISREKLEQEEIDKWDERNIAIIRASATAAEFRFAALISGSVSRPVIPGIISSRIIRS